MNRKQFFTATLIAMALLVVVSIASFSTLGDPTRNVEVANFPLDANGNLRVSESRNLQNYTDVIEFTVLEGSRQYSTGDESGICVYNVGAIFAFTPKQKFLNVTRFGYQMVLYKDQSGINNYYYNILLNEQFVHNNWYEQVDSYPMSRTWDFSDPNVCSLIHEGINIFRLDPIDEPFFVLKLKVFIEYTYQA